MSSPPTWHPCVEPWPATARRTGGLAVLIGLGVGLYSRHLGLVPTVTLVALWFTLGGHFVEILFRNHLRRYLRLPGAVDVVARLAWWFAGGTVLYAGALATRAALTGRGPAPWPWWSGGVAFLAIELVVHLLLRARGVPSFYDGRG